MENTHREHSPTYLDTSQLEDVDSAKHYGTQEGATDSVWGPLDRGDIFAGLRGSEGCSVYSVNGVAKHCS